VYTGRLGRVWSTGGSVAILNRAYRWAAAAAGVLALAAALSRVWWLAAAAAGLAGAVAIFARPSESVSVSSPEEVLAGYEPAIVLPATPDAEEVVRSVFKAAAHRVNAVSAHLWLQDPATATLRLVAASGERLPASTPLSLDDPFIEGVVSRGVSTLEAFLSLTEGAASTRLWRYAFLVSGSPAAGICCVDVESAVRPNPGSFQALESTLRAACATALALHVARDEALRAANLIDAAYELSRRLEPAEVVRVALDRAVVLSSAVSGSIMLTSDDGETLRIAESVGLPDEVVQGTVVRPGEGIAGWVFSSGRPLLVEDLPNAAGSRRRGVCSSVSVPIADEDGSLGVLNVGSREFPARFTDEHLRALEILGRQTAVALRNARAVDSSTDLYFATLTALSVALETKDPYARGTTGRVVGLVNAIASGMGLSAVDSHALNVAAILHDIGMGVAGGPIGMSARPLSTVERGMLKAHPVIAAEILADVPALREVVPIVYHHHEWYDGHGYVGGLAGETIPLGSRILAVADAFVAMTSERPYRRALSVSAALGEMVSKAESQFDPVVVEVLRRELEEHPELVRTTGV
jgi:HD-GYP domain-containing protein (c-di-GMP phosphodiesterase class II)